MNKRRYTYLIILLCANICCAAFGMDKDVKSAIFLKNKGDACYNANRLPEALEYYADALDKAKEVQDMRIYNACIGNIGNIYASTGDIRRAIFYFKKGYQASVEQEDVDMQSKYIANIVAAYCMLGRADNAKKFFRLQTQLPMSDKRLKQYYFYTNQALIARVENNLKMAEYYHRMAADYACDHGMEIQYVISDLSMLARLQMDKKQYREAIDYLNQCVDTLTQVGNNSLLVNVYRQLSAAYDSLGDRKQASRLKALSLELSDSIFDREQMNMASAKLFEYENHETQLFIDELMFQNNAKMIALSLTVLLLALLLAFFVVLKRKNKNLLETQQTLVGKIEALMQSEQKSKDMMRQYAAMVDRENNTKSLDDVTADNMAVGDVTIGDVQHSDTEGSQQRSDIGLTEEQVNRLVDKINKVMDDVETISQPDFSLATLAELTLSNSKYVSWVINAVYDKNFKTFLNEYRIKEATKRLSDPKNFGVITIQTVYQDLGYNSASSFIAAFKKINGMTPSTYQRLVMSRK